VIGLGTWQLPELSAYLSKNISFLRTRIKKNRNITQHEKREYGWIVGPISCMANKQWKDRQNSHEKLRSLRLITKVARRFPRRAVSKKMEYLAWRAKSINHRPPSSIAATASSASLQQKEPWIPLAILNDAITAARKKRRCLRLVRLSWRLYCGSESEKRARSQQGRKLIGGDATQEAVVSYSSVRRALLSHTVNIINLFIRPSLFRLYCCLI